MGTRQQFIYTLLSFFLLSSCSTILNRKTIGINVFTNTPARINLPNCSSNGEVTSSSFEVTRSKKPLIITASNDSVSKTVKVKSKNSSSFWLNLSYMPYSLVGFFIDWKNPKRFAYPRNIYIDLKKNDNSYIRMIPIPQQFQKYTTILSLTPLKIIDGSNPAVDFTAERKINSSFSGGLEFGYLLPGSKENGIGNNVNPEAKGISAGMEAKWFPHHSAPQGLYYGLGFNYLVSSYKAAQDFWHVTTDSISGIPLSRGYTDTFNIHKQTYTINMMIGYQRIYKRFSLDIYGGLGLRFKNVIYTDRKFPGDNWKFELLHFIDASYLKNCEGKYSTITVPINIRLGWTF